MFTNPFKKLDLFFFFEGETGAAAGGAPKEEIKETSKANLKEVIQNASVEVAKQVGDEIKKEETSKEPIKETPKDESKEDVLTEEQRKYADTLYKGLNNKDPKIQLGTLKILANAAGLDLKEIETKKEAAKAEETLIDLLKAGLGEYDFLADKLGPVLEKVMDKFVETKTKDIREEQKQIKLEKQQEFIETNIQAAFKEYSNANDFKDDVFKLMDLYHPSNKVTPKEYFKSLLVIAANNKGIELKLVNSKPKEERVTRNRTDAMSRLASERNVEVKEISRIPQKMSLKESVQDAAEKAAELLTSKK